MVRSFQHREAIFNTELIRSGMDDRTAVNFSDGYKAERNHARTKRYRTIVGAVNGYQGSSPGER